MMDFSFSFMYWRYFELLISDWIALLGIPSMAISESRYSSEVLARMKTFLVKNSAMMQPMDHMSIAAE